MFFDDFQTEIIRTWDLQILRCSSINCTLSTKPCRAWLTDLSLFAWINSTVPLEHKKCFLDSVEDPPYQIRSQKVVCLNIFSQRNNHLSNLCFWAFHSSLAANNLVSWKFFSRPLAAAAMVRWLQCFFLLLHVLQIWFLQQKLQNKFLTVFAAFRVLQSGFTAKLWVKTAANVARKSKGARSSVRQLSLVDEAVSVPFSNLEAWDALLVDAGRTGTHRSEGQLSTLRDGSPCTNECFHKPETLYWILVII